MELIRFTEHAEQVTLKDLEVELKDVLDRIIFISDYSLLTEQEIRMNNTAFQWYYRMPQVLEENRLIVEKYTRVFQSALRGVLYT